MSEALTDRDRLASAFADLRERGYYADITMSYRICCRDHALKEMALALHDGEPDEDEMLDLPEKFVFWYAAKDDWSFVGSGDGFPIPSPYREMDEDTLDAISDEVDAAITSSRLSEYVDLVKPLNLHWFGNADEIVGVLREHGLTADVPNSDNYCIEIAPTRKPAPITTGV